MFTLVTVYVNLYHARKKSLNNTQNEVEHTLIVVLLECFVELDCLFNKALSLHHFCKYGLSIAVYKSH